jgi:hypothetical protein
MQPKLEIDSDNESMSAVLEPSGEMVEEAARQLLMLPLASNDVSHILLRVR